MMQLIPDNRVPILPEKLLDYPKYPISQYVKFQDLLQHYQHMGLQSRAKYCIILSKGSF